MVTLIETHKFIDKESSVFREFISLKRIKLAIEHNTQQQIAQKNSEITYKIENKIKTKARQSKT